MKIKTNWSTVGSSFHRLLSKEEHEAMYNFLDLIDCNYPLAADIINNTDQVSDVLTQTDDNEKYSDSLVFTFDGVVFCVYSSYGRFRIGAGGTLSSPRKVTEQIINAFLDEVELIAC